MYIVAGIQKNVLFHSEVYTIKRATGSDPNQFSVMDKSERMIGRWESDKYTSFCSGRISRKWLAQGSKQNMHGLLLEKETI